MQDKRMELADVIATISDGAVLALGGNTLHRSPSAAVHEIVRQHKRDLEIVKTAGAYDVDLLCAAGCAAAVSAGYIGYETPFGMAPAYRRGVEQGSVVAREHACATVIAGFRAAIQGVPFMPVAGLFGSQLPEQRGFPLIADPFSAAEVYVVPAIRPDVAIIHVQEADREGNARIIGTRFEDVLMAQAARSVIVTTERIVDGETFVATPETVAIPGFLVNAVVPLPGGAWPCSCTLYYGYDDEFLAAWIDAARDADRARAFIATRILGARSAEA
ncbi:MAG: CoA-transferase [Thermomicrobiales bacterium]